VPLTPHRQAPDGSTTAAGQRLTVVSAGTLVRHHRGAGEIMSRAEPLIRILINGSGPGIRRVCNVDREVKTAAAVDIDSTLVLLVAAS